MVNKVIIDPVVRPKAIVNPNPAQKASCNAIGIIHAEVVRVVTNIGFSLETAHCVIAIFRFIHLCKLLLNLSIMIIASFTTIHIKLINHTHTGIERGFQVI
jgi:hypothetical protein